MTTLTLDLPEALTAEIDAAVQAGWFTSQAEAVRAAVRDMMSHRKLALLEQQQLADIDWAVDAAMEASMNVVVTDTGPLLHLQQVGAMHLLAHLGSIQVTPTVWSELQRHAPSLAISGLPAWLSLAQPSASAMSQASQWVNAQVLHAGEAEALAYARETQADLFLTDDTAARTMGESLGIHVRGSLGVVLFAAASGHLDKAACLQILTDLEMQSTLWMSAKVKSAARQAVSQIFGSP